MKKDMKHMISFFLVTFIWTWAFHFPIVWFHLDWSKGIGLLLFLAGGPAPSLMGIIMVFKTFNQRQRQDYFSRCTDLRRIGMWFLFPIILFPLLAVIGVVLDSASGGTMPGMAALNLFRTNPTMILGLLFLYLGSGPLNEEFGWRGYALDLLLVKFGFLRGSVIMGVVWGIWHLPWCFMAGQGQRFDTFWLYVLSLVGLSLAISLMYIKTDRSILAAIVMHFCSNLFTSQLLSPTSAQYETLRMILLCVLGCLVAGYAAYNRYGFSAQFRNEATMLHG